MFSFVKFLLFIFLNGKKKQLQHVIIILKKLFKNMYVIINNAKFLRK